MPDYIKTELAKYNLPEAKIAELKSKYIKLKAKGLEDIDSYMACKSAHQEIKGIRVAIEKKRVELKASSLSFGRAIDSEAKRLTAGVAEIEDHLLTQPSLKMKRKGSRKKRNAKLGKKKKESSEKKRSVLKRFARSKKRKSARSKKRKIV